MDWSDVSEFVSFGAVGKEHIEEGVDYYIILSPQNVVGTSIIPILTEM